jgi:hypothetical protein
MTSDVAIIFGTRLSKKKGRGSAPPCKTPAMPRTVQPCRAMPCRAMHRRAQLILDLPSRAMLRPDIIHHSMDYCHYES